MLTSSIWFITFAFFYEVFKEHFVSTKVLTVEGVPSKLNNVSIVKTPDVNDLGFEKYVSTPRISIERR